MSFFKIATPLSYLLLVVLWLSILVLYVRIRQHHQTSMAMKVLLGVLALDALRTLFESLYFGVFRSAQAGFIPTEIATLLGQPTMVFVPKMVNVLVAILVLFLLLRRWVPLLVKEQYEQKQQIERLNLEISERQQVEQELRETREHFRHLAHHDVLTGLPNRELLLDRIQQEIYKADRAHNTLAVLFIDLDRFKQINDSLGHAAGDKVLGVAATRLKEAVRHDDTVSRIGGDEFVAVINGAQDVQAVGEVATKIRQQMEQPFAVDQHQLYISCSIGISIYGQDGSEPEVLLSNADAAMYRAKAEGRNTVEFYTRDMTEEVLRRMMFASQLRTALEENQFVLHFQPQYDLRTGRIAGVEALIRWQHPELGLLSPENFVPLAEETGLIVPIGEWVLRNACQTLRSWMDEGFDLDRMAVNINLSSRQLRHERLNDQVFSILKEYGIPAQQIELEITEGTLMQDPESAAKVLQRFMDEGIEISIDDFGTGYSSLSYLKRLPINKLKIDRSFVSDIPHSQNDMEIARAVIALARSLNLTVVGEGVETEAQAEFLRVEGCDVAQGYLYSKPVPADQMLQHFRSGMTAPVLKHSGAVIAD